MSHQVEIHPTQILILRGLLFAPHAAFADLMRATGLESDLFNFHLQALIKQQYVIKTESGLYMLTPTGKEHANKLDTDSNTIERQPKISALLTIIRHADRGPEILLQQRLKQPFYGFWGLPSGKVRWGETIIQTAQRELLEETGLTCPNVVMQETYHKIDYDKDSGDLLEDKIFFNVLCLNPEGQLIEEFEGGKNQFFTQSELATIDKAFEGIEKGFERMAQNEITFTEKAHLYSKDEY